MPYVRWFWKTILLKLPTPLNMSTKVEMILELNELLFCNAITAEEFAVSKNLLFLEEFGKIQQLKDSWNSFKSNTLSKEEFENSKRLILNMTKVEKIIKNPLIQKEEKPIVASNPQLGFDKTETTKFQIQIHEWNNLRGDIELIKKNQAQILEVIFYRIRKAGNYTKSIYNALAWQFVIGILFGILYQNPSILTSIKIDLNNPNSEEFKKLTDYYTFLNIFFGLVTFVILVIIVQSLKGVADNLAKVSHPKEADKESNDIWFYLFIPIFVILFIYLFILIIRDFI